MSTKKRSVDMYNGVTTSVENTRNNMDSHTSKVIPQSF